MLSKQKNETNKRQNTYPFYAIAQIEILKAGFIFFLLCFKAARTEIFSLRLQIFSIKVFKIQIILAYTQHKVKNERRKILAFSPLIAEYLF